MGMCLSANEDRSASLQEKPPQKFQKNLNRPQPIVEFPQESTSTKGGSNDGPDQTSPDGSQGRKLYTPKDVKELRQHPGYSNCELFTFEELKVATKHFRPDLIIGEGGFGVVYRGYIDEATRPGYKTRDVAVKQLNRNGFQGDREWLTEVSYLGNLSHPNLVKLIGYCCEDEHRLLVYEYMASGCWEKHLFRRTSATLTWIRRVKILLDAAKGLAYLHDLPQPIIYRDFKTSNVLLDSDFNAKLSDFGLAKEGPTGDQTHVSTRVMGTYGYAAPEYIMTGHLTTKSDVYGFGVVLLEMLIGRRAFDKSRPSREHDLVDWCRPLLNNNKKLLRILDARIDGQYSESELMRVAYLGYQCLSQNSKVRPSMSQVVELLESVYEQELGRCPNGSPETLNEAQRVEMKRKRRKTKSADDKGLDIVGSAARRRKSDRRCKSEFPSDSSNYSHSPDNTSP